MAVNATRTASPRLARLADALSDWFAASARDLPWRRTRDPYAIWISEIMLQQTQVKAVVPYWERWMRALPDVQALARAEEDKVLKLWEGLGYYRRARHLREAARAIVDRHEGRFPTRYAEVLALPGVGRYTAGAVCSLAFGYPTPAVDGNVVRVLARIFAIRTRVDRASARQRFWALAQALVRQAFETRASRSPFSQPCAVLNQSLMELGAVVCLPRAPRCGECPVKVLCAARRLGLVETLPRKPKRPPMRRRYFAALLIERAGRLLVRRRSAGEVNGGLHELPNVEVPAEREMPSAVRIRRALGAAFEVGAPVLRLRHAIMRDRIDLTVYRGSVRGGNGARFAGSRWVPLGRLPALAFAAAHRKALRGLGLLKSTAIASSLSRSRAPASTASRARSRSRDG